MYFGFQNVETTVKVYLLLSLKNAYLTNKGLILSNHIQYSTVLIK